MTIHNVYFTAVYSVWIYILILLLAKLAADRIRSVLSERRMTQIRRYFMPGQLTAGKRQKQERRIERYGSNLLLLTCACRAYRKGLPQYADRERERLESLIGRMLRSYGGRTCTAEEQCTLAALWEYCSLPCGHLPFLGKEPGKMPAMKKFWQNRVAQKEGQQL